MSEIQVSDDRIRKLEMFAQSRRNDPDNSAITTSHWVGYLEGLDAMKQIVTGKTPTDNSDEQRYGDMDSWPQRAHTMRQRLLRDELPDRERPARYSPDLTPIERTHVFIQWKGTNVCLDFHCECGAHGHFNVYNWSAACGGTGQAEERSEA